MHADWMPRTGLCELFSGDYKILNLLWTAPHIYGCQSFLFKTIKVLGFSDSLIYMMRYWTKSVTWTFLNCCPSILWGVVSAVSSVEATTSYSNSGGTPETDGPLICDRIKTVLIYFEILRTADFVGVVFSENFHLWWFGQSCNTLQKALIPKRPV